MKNFGWLLGILLLIGGGARAVDIRGWEVKSPDGNLTAELDLSREGRLSYHIKYRGELAMAESPLGIVRADQRFVEHLKLDAERRDKVVEDYTMPHGKRSRRHMEANELTVAFKNADNAFVQLIFRVTNDGVAFRYRFPETNPATKTVIAELTGFQFASGQSKVWRQPYDAATMWTPAYERIFDNGVPADATSTNKVGWCFPALFQVRDRGPWVLVTEALLDGSYCGCRLESDVPNGLYRIRFPEANEGNGTGQVAPSHTLPWATPWRVVLVGQTPGAFVESTLVDDLNPPPAVPVPAWIKPGRVAWSWWSEQDSPRKPERMKAFIDLAAELGWEYFLVDANWNFIPEPEFLALLDYAKKKNVGILLWYNSGGPHNTVTEAPRDRMMPATRREELAKLQRWGVKGIKVDFFQSDKQNIIEHYIDILRDAAEFGIMVNFHGCTMQRGWARTFPHLMTMEGVRGAECYIFDPKFPAAAPSHNTILALTRNVVGSMDYTPVCFADNKNKHLTTVGHELALSVVFESGWTHFADGAASYCATPGYVKDFLRRIPVAWDDTKCLAATPGEEVVIARRRGNDWWLGALNGTDKPRTLSVALDFLPDGNFALNRIGDGQGPRDFAQAAPATVKRGDKLSVELLPFGGCAAHLAPR